MTSKRVQASRVTRNNKRGVQQPTRSSAQPRSSLEPLSKKTRSNESDRPQSQSNNSGVTDENTQTQLVCNSGPDPANGRDSLNTDMENRDASSPLNPLSVSPSTNLNQRQSGSPATIRRCLSLSERRRIRNMNHSVINLNENNPVTYPETPLSASTTENNASNSVLPSEYNRIKLKLAEALAEKRTLRAGSDALIEQCERMKKELRSQKQQIMALEAANYKSASKGRKSSKKGSWTQEDDRSSIAVYKGIKLQFDLIVNKYAEQVVTESNTKRDGMTRVRDWTGSSVVVTTSEARKAVLYVTLPNGSVAVPRCAMELAASTKFYTDRFENSSSYIRDALRSMLEGHSGIDMNTEEKEDCLSKLSTYPSVVSKFRTAMREQTNNRKQGAKVDFLKGLGFKRATMGEIKDNDHENKRRLDEKQMVRDIFVRNLETNQPDTMSWRLRSIDEIRNPDRNCNRLIAEMEQAEQNLSEDGGVDYLFLNEPARIAFHQFRGYKISENKDEQEQDATVLSLARADAWMTTALRNICVTGRGGMRSNEFQESYETLVKKSLQRIVKDAWDDIDSLAPLELTTRMGDIFTDDDPYLNNNREWTIVIHSTDDGHLYLLATPKYFSMKLCSWYGRCKDFQIGRARVGQEKFTRITESTLFDDFEESDVENDVDQPTNSLPSSSNDQSYE